MKQEKFYQSSAWKRKREIILQRDGYQCQDCKRYGKATEAVTVHHIKRFEDFPELAFTSGNLISLCAKCHNKRHPEKGGRRF